MGQRSGEKALDRFPVILLDGLSLRLSASAFTIFFTAEPLRRRESSSVISVVRVPTFFWEGW
jgi:hypothetical protein